MLPAYIIEEIMKWEQEKQLTAKGNHTENLLFYSDGEPDTEPDTNEILPDDCNKNIIAIIDFLF